MTLCPKETSAKTALKEIAINVEQKASSFALKKQI